MCNIDMGFTEAVGEREKNDTRLERSSINWKCSNAI